MTIYTAFFLNILSCRIYSIQKKQNNQNVNIYIWKIFKEKSVRTNNGLTISIERAQYHVTDTFTHLQSVMCARVLLYFHPLCWGNFKIKQKKIYFYIKLY